MLIGPTGEAGTADPMAWWFHEAKRIHRGKDGRRMDTTRNSRNEGVLSATASITMETASESSGSRPSSRDSKRERNWQQLYADFRAGRMPTPVRKFCCARSFCSVVNLSLLLLSLLLWQLQPRLRSLGRTWSRNMSIAKHQAWVSKFWFFRSYYFNCKWVCGALNACQPLNANLKSRRRCSAPRCRHRARPPVREIRSGQFVITGRMLANETETLVSFVVFFGYNPSWAMNVAVKCCQRVGWRD